MRILLTGASGQLGRAFRDVATSAGHEIIALHHNAPEGSGERAVDLEDAEQAARAVRDARPDAVVHAAAMTNVDQCEREPERAHAVNALATGALARAAHEVGARFVYVSTDYVFDGEKGGYAESDATDARSAYGRTKLEGEREAQRAHPEAVIARTSVVFGPHKKNFVTWVIGELRAGRGVRIVEDQRVSPTYTYDLAEQILALLDARATGAWHTAGATALSRLDMARAIAQAFDLDASLIAPVKSADLEWLAPRPRDSTLDVSKIAALKAPLTFGEALERLRKVHFP